MPLVASEIVLGLGLGLGLDLDLHKTIGVLKAALS